MFKLFKKIKKNFNPGSIFAFTKGILIGKMVVLVDSSEEKSFLMLPDMLPYTMKNDEFYFNYRNKTLDYIEELPDDVFVVVKAQYLKSIHAA